MKFDEGAQPEKLSLNITPLIDVVFLLLIFFMVATVFPENRGLIIEKPESKQSEPLVIKKIVFVVNEKGDFFFQNQTVTPADIERLVKEQLKSAPDTAVLLQVDRRATTEVLIKAMDACKLGGAKQVGIATDALHTKS